MDPQILTALDPEATIRKFRIVHREGEPTRSGSENLRSARAAGPLSVKLTTSDESDLRKSDTMIRSEALFNGCWVGA